METLPVKSDYIGELPGELRNQIYGYIFHNGKIPEYAGYLTSNKRTYLEASGTILSELKNTLMDVETAWYLETGLPLCVDKPASLADVKTITVSLPNTYFSRQCHDLSLLQPSFIHVPGLLAPPLNPLLDVPCSVLKFRLYDDPAWLNKLFPNLQLLSSESFQSLGHFCKELGLITRVRATDIPNGDPEPQTGATGCVKAASVMFEWGSMYRHGLVMQLVRFFDRLASSTLVSISGLRFKWLNINSEWLRGCHNDKELCLTS